MSEIPTSVGLKNIKDGKAPRSRLESASDACALVGLLSSANEQRAIVEQKVRGMLDGNPPYSPSLLKQQGQSYRCNVNFREAEAIHTAAVNPYYDLFAEARYFADIQLEGGSQAERVLNSRVATEEFHNTLREYDGFDYNMQVALGDMVDFGRGFIFWEDPDNWWFKSVKQQRVFVPDNTPADVTQLELLVLRQPYKVHELWKKIRDEKSAAEVGWNVAECMKQMEQAQPDENQQDETAQLDDIQQRIRSNDLFESVRSNAIQAAHLFVKEFSGKITHLIVSEGEVISVDGTREKKEFMFRKLERFDSFRQVLGALFFDVGDATWHSIKGLLTKIHPFIEVKNRINCAVVDNTFVNLSVLLQPNTERSFQESVIQQQGPFMILKHGLQIQQWGLAGRMEEGLAVEQRLDNKLSSNIGQYRPTIRREDGNPETATKVRADEFKEQTLNKGAVNRMYQHLDHVYREIYRRMTLPGLVAEEGGMGPKAQALDFVKRCRERGVPIEKLRKVRKIRAFRNVGNGSPFMRVQSIQDVGGLVPLMNDAGRQNYLDDAISVSTNHEMVERYNPKTGEKPSDDHVIAALQVAGMKEGVWPVMSDTQDHFVFAQVYMEAAMAEFKALQQGQIQPLEALKFLSIVGPSIAKRLQAIPENHIHAKAAKVLEQQWRQLQQLTKQLEQQVGQQQQQQAQSSQQGQQAISKEEIEQQVAMRDQQRKDQAASADIQRKQAKAQVDSAMKIRKTEEAIQLNRRKALDSKTVSEK